VKYTGLKPKRVLEGVERRVNQICSKEDYFEMRRREVVEGKFDNRHSNLALVINTTLYTGLFKMIHPI
jgi:hypothetical protein